MRFRLPKVVSCMMGFILASGGIEIVSAQPDYPFRGPQAG
jgi:hypothetical protein